MILCAANISKQMLPVNETEKQIMYMAHEAADDTELPVPSENQSLYRVSAAGSSTCWSQHSTQPRRSAGQKPSEVRL